jgi:D-3-phosphoglycerate dehydrogenase
MTERFKILLTSPIHDDGMAILEPAADVVVAPDTAEGTYRNLAADVDGIIVRNKLPDDILEHGPKIKGIVRHGVGLDFIPVAAATARGVAVANLPGCNSQTVAEYCVAAMLHLRRPLANVDRKLRADGWNPSRALSDDFLEIGGSVLGIVGVGSIGRQLAKIAGSGFGMTVIGSSRRKGNMPEGVEEVELDDLFRRADAIALCCALTDETRGLVDERRIGLMKPGAVIVNVSRGPVVDTEALMRALNAGAIAGAATDVYDQHPLTPDHPLLSCPNTLLTPHMAGLTDTSTRAMSTGAANDILRILRGEAPFNLVNPEYRAQGGSK